LPAGPKRGARAVAHLPALPFVDAVFDVAIANLVLGNAHDLPHLAELRRVLRPGGWLLSTIAVRGSFDELFDLVFDVCDEPLRTRARARQAAFPDDDALGPRFTAAGFTLAQTGFEERLLCLVDGDTLLHDALITDVLLPSFLGRPVPPETRASWAPAAHARFPGGMPLRARTAIVTARRPTADAVIKA
jgi:SAM-dependent methyltransferase